MCGRYAFYSPAEAVTRLFGVPETAQIEPRYNVAPTQYAPVVRAGRDGAPRLDMMRWGLVPFWARDLAIGNRMINARAETLAEKPAYRESFQKRRCIVPANGFYEWQKQGRTKQPFLIGLDDDELFGMAGLWATWRPRGDADERLESFTIVTTTPNETVAPLHDRMPVILTPADYDAWLDPANDDPTALQAMLQPFDAAPLRLRPVSRAVNDPRNEGPDLVTADSLV